MTPATESRALSDRRTSKPRSGGECEVGALGIGTYWFAGSVNEITPRPRPASPGSTTIVETDHPLCSCQAAPARRRRSNRSGAARQGIRKPTSQQRRHPDHSPTLRANVQVSAAARSWPRTGPGRPRRSSPAEPRPATRPPRRTTRTGPSGAVRAPAPRPPRPCAAGRA